jgi:hypothetical protein
MRSFISLIDMKNWITRSGCYAWMIECVLLAISDMLIPQCTIGGLANSLPPNIFYIILQASPGQIYFLTNT